MRTIRPAGWRPVVRSGISRWRPVVPWRGWSVAWIGIDQGPDDAGGSRFDPVSRATMWRSARPTRPSESSRTPWGRRGGEKALAGECAEDDPKSGYRPFAMTAQQGSAIGIHSVASNIWVQDTK